MRPRRRPSWSFATACPRRDSQAPLGLLQLGPRLQAGTIQVLKEETEKARERRWFESWLEGHPNNSLVLRGVRTVRHLAVHVGDIRTHSGVEISVVKGRGGTITRSWSLPGLTPEVLRSLRSPKLREDELDAWKDLRKKWGAQKLMEDALSDLRQIVFDAKQFP